VGVYGGVVDADFVVDVVASSAAGVADVTYDLSASDGLTDGDGKAAHVSVAGDEAAAMVDGDEASVAVDHAGVGDDAVGGGVNGGAEGAADVDAGMELTFTIAQDGVFALAERGGYFAVNGPEGGAGGEIGA